ncbi:unnamed protein product [Moneuplotes crassus]|uniref:Uncharacterized protein n=1 Tax=Euplotes crassus TaxID=5936 RepID=A0AAD1UDS5_EUPCR|nr:unnamed protein product [Moneuplotes crassus]
MEQGFKICSCRNGADCEPQLHFGHPVDLASTVAASSSSSISITCIFRIFSSESIVVSGGIIIEVKVVFVT